MKLRQAILFVWFLFPSVLHAQQAATPGPSFSFVRTTFPEKGHAILVRQVTVVETVQVVKKVNINGKLTDVATTEQLHRAMEYDVVYDLAASRVITSDGKQLPINEVWKRLQKNTVVAISGDFDTPSASYLRALNPETLVIIPAAPKAAPAPK